MNIADIMVYPIKSLRGSPVDESLLCSYGLEHDQASRLGDSAQRL